MKSAVGELVIEAVGITKRFGGVVANDEVDLCVHANEVVGIIGPNGSGKTTLLNILSGAYQPDHGQVKFRGDVITGFNPAELCRRGIARTFQLLRLFYGMTVLENVMVGAFVQASQVKSARQIAMKYVTQVGLQAKAFDLASTLSTGQRKRLELARAMATNPTILLLDEVLAGVDPGNRRPLLELLRGLKQDGMSLVLVEHNLEVVSQLCDRLISLDQGRKVAEGLPSEVLSDERVIGSYLGARRA